MHTSKPGGWLKPPPTLETMWLKLEPHRCCCLISVNCSHRFVSVDTIPGKNTSTNSESKQGRSSSITPVTRGRCQGLFVRFWALAELQNLKRIGNALGLNWYLTSLRLTSFIGWGGRRYRKLIDGEYRDEETLGSIRSEKPSTPRADVVRNGSWDSRERDEIDRVDLFSFGSDIESPRRLRGRDRSPRRTNEGGCDCHMLVFGDWPGKRYHCVPWGRRQSLPIWADMYPAKALGRSRHMSTQALQRPPALPTGPGNAVYLVNAFSRLRSSKERGRIAAQGRNTRRLADPEFGCFGGVRASRATLRNPEAAWRRRDNPNRIGARPNPDTRASLEQRTSPRAKKKGTGGRGKYFCEGDVRAKQKNFFLELVRAEAKKR
ncbi:hypothetical protein DFH09DRAFT_1078601 [Mycena vulgaris]|nr:hypothetical protein DFH09DRAFT_1078601 [Mycena vulgaris]